VRKNKIVGWDGVAESYAIKRIEREMERLRVSFEAARKDGYSRFIMFLHYPPTNVMERNSDGLRTSTNPSFSRLTNHRL